MFHRLFIANRGECAVRILRGCDALGITPVLGVSEADRVAPYVKGREHVVLGPARSALSYLDAVRVLGAAKESRCSALHPGWGFLSENPLLAALCAQHGITFVGPPPTVMRLMGKKTSAKRAMRDAGLAVIPGSDGLLADVADAERVAASVGFPVLLKAESGGGGRGMRIARAPSEVARAYDEASAEATAAFGDGRLYLEKLIEQGRHVEIQILADNYGNVVHLGERDCTIQRNHQKLLEESPSPALSDDERAETLAAAARAARDIGYVGAGTIEMLLDETGKLRFMEMNTRLQVEHTVTEMRTGLDLVAEQIRIASGIPLGLPQADVRFRGHAIEVRINAEDPAHDFRPAPGLIAKWEPPSTTDGRLRVETHVATGYEVPPYYDSMICKLIAWGETRDSAADRLLAALAELVVEGVPTTAPLHRAILASPDFRSGKYSTSAIPGFTRE